MNKFYVLLITCLLTAYQVMSQVDVDYEYSQKDDYYDELGEEQQSTEPVVHEPPPVFKEKSKKITVREGDSLQLSCETVETTRHVALFKKETIEPHTEVVKQLILFAGTVMVYESNFKNKGLIYTVDHISRKDAASYLCVYQTNHGEIQIKYEVNVEYPPHIRPIKPSRREVMKGDDVSFECKADGNPKPKVKWSRENGDIPAGAADDNGTMITFWEVDRHLEGIYVCSAENGIGNTAVLKKKLLVQYSPEISAEKDIVRTGDGDMVELICIVHSRPSAVVTWSRENKTIAQSSNSKQTNEGNRHSLIISRVTEEEFGMYNCTATNSIGITSAEINITDLPMKPNFTSDPTSAHDNKYTLTWNTESYYNITEYRIKYRPIMANTTEEASWIEKSYEISEGDVEETNQTHRMKHAISGLKAATDYEAIVSVKNDLKWGDISSFNFSTKKESASHITGAGSLVSTSITLLIASRMVSMIS